MQGKIVRLRESDDIALGFIFLGITALVLGVAMLIGSVSGLVYFANHGLKATTLMVNTMYNGIAFVICSGMSLLMTSMLVFTIKNEIVLGYTDGGSINNKSTWTDIDCYFEGKNETIIRQISPIKLKNIFLFVFWSF